MPVSPTPETAPASPSPAPAALGPAPAIAARIHGESGYDRVTSLLMAVIISAAIVVGWLGLIYLTNRSYARSVPAAIEIIEVIGGGGGSPEGVEGETEQVDVADAVILQEVLECCHVHAVT